MRIEMDLLRDIILYLEAKSLDRAITNINLPIWTAEQIAYHVWYLREAGYILTSFHAYPSCDITSPPRMEYFIDGITLAGHDFANEARCPFIWSNIITIAHRVGIGGLRAIRLIAAGYLNANISRELHIEGAAQSQKQ